MSKTYLDKYSRYHDRPCKKGIPSSNNGWTYTAYGKYLAPDTSSYEQQQLCFSKCLRSEVPLRVDRSPNDPTPPLSKDEVIGLVSLGLLTAGDLQDSHWNFCNLEYEPKKLTLWSIYKAFKEFRKMDKEIKELKLEGGDKRNYMWQNNRTDAYSLGFWLQPWDQYYVNKYNNQKVTIFQTILFYINFYFVLTGYNKSVKMLLWLQLTDMNHWLLKYVPKEKYVRAYFEPNHPFVKGL